VSNEQDRVPPEVEDYLVGVIAKAAGAGASGQAGASAAAKRMKTVVVERTVLAGSGGDIADGIRTSLPHVFPLDAAEGLLRFAVPLGRTGLNHVVVDVFDGGRMIRAYGKEGLLGRKPTRRTADEFERVIAG